MAEGTLHHIIYPSRPSQSNLSTISASVWIRRRGNFSCSFRFELRKPWFLRGAFTAQTGACWPKPKRVPVGADGGGKSLGHSWVMCWLAGGHVGVMRPRPPIAALWQIGILSAFHIYIIYLCRRLRHMIAVMAKSALKQFLPLFFSSWYKCHPFILQIGQWCCNSVLNFQSAHHVKDYTSHQHVVGFEVFTIKRSSDFFFF